MKKWQIILISIITGLIALSVAGFCIFKFYIVPQYIDPMLRAAVQILNDEDIQEEISEAAREMADRGLLDVKLVDDYSQTVNNRKKSAADKAEAENADDKSETDNVEYIEKNSVGASNIKVQEDEKKYSYSNPSSAKVKPSVNTKTDDNISFDFDSNDEDSMLEKLSTEISSKDMARLYAISSKIDRAKVKSLSSDRKALKEYIKSVLSEEEYAEGMELYMKYAHLMN